MRNLYLLMVFYSSFLLKRFPLALIEKSISIDGLTCHAIKGVCILCPLFSQIVGCKLELLKKNKKKKELFYIFLSILDSFMLHMHVSSDDQFADAFTKPVLRSLFAAHSDKINLSTCDLSLILKGCIQFKRNIKDKCIYFSDKIKSLILSIFQIVFYCVQNGIIHLSLINYCSWRDLMRVKEHLLH